MTTLIDAPALGRLLRGHVKEYRSVTMNYATFCEYHGKICVPIITPGKCLKNGHPSMTTQAPDQQFPSPGGNVLIL